ncbi:MAG: protein kinase [Gemmatimonadetes bacterium]|nr:protein kinase [Gemmatimonadota bacterium]
MADSQQDIRDVLPDRFTILREIGRGGMATVYLAEERQPRRLVAIKVLREDLGARIGRDRFIREVELLSTLAHPHIVPIFASGDADGLLYYVMPYQEGENLRDRMLRERQLPLEFALRIAREIADALEYAHGRNVVHRDIKPENVLISGEHAVVADFGIARAISAAGGDELTETGLSVGTPVYMSPEQASLGESLDGRADIYALGCVLYEMLAGHPPFTAANPQAVMARHAVDPVPSLRTVRTSVPAEVEAAIVKSLAKVPADRYTHAAEFSEALTTASAMARLEMSTPPGTAPFPGLVRSRVKRWTAPVSVILIVLAAAVGFWSWRGVGGTPAVASSVYEDSVAVLPFEKIGGDEEFEHLRDGLMYEITSRLAQFGRLKVTARTSVMALANLGLTAGQLADSFGVRYLVEGSVQPSGNRVRVSAQLIEARSETILWSGQYEREFTDVLDVQEDIADEVSAALLSTVAAARPGGGSRRHSPGHSAYLEGRDLLAQRTPQAFAAAIEAFEEAIRLDSLYARAYSGLASVYALSVTYRYRIGANANEAAGTALAMADTAIALNARLAAAYSARGYASSIALAPTDSVRRDFERAMALQPNSPDGPAWWGHLLVREGRFSEALATARRAVRLDPFAASRRISLAYEALRDRRYPLVVEQTRAARRFAPQLLLPRELGARAMLMSGRADDCAAMELGPHAGLVATCLHELGRVAEARRIVDSLETRLRAGEQLDTLFTNVVAAQDLASFYGWIGDVDGALDWLAEAYAQSPSGVDLRTIESGMFDKVRNDARFDAELERLRKDIWPRVSAERRRVKERGLIRD